VALSLIIHVKNICEELAKRERDHKCNGQEIFGEHVGACMRKEAPDLARVFGMMRKKNDREKKGGRQRGRSGSDVGIGAKNGDEAVVGAHAGLKQVCAVCVCGCRCVLC
jgi:hypothetical protein